MLNEPNHYQPVGVDPASIFPPENCSDERGERGSLAPPLPTLVTPAPAAEIPEFERIVAPPSAVEPEDVDDAALSALVSTSPTRPVGEQSEADEANDVFTPAPRTNPVIAAMKRSGLYLDDQGGGSHLINCPWASEHSKGEATEAEYIEPSEAHPAGRFRCAHNHADRRSIGDVANHLDVSLAAARCKPVIRIMPGELNRVVDSAERELARDSKIFKAGGAIVTVSRDPSSGDLSTALIGDQQLLRRLSRDIDWEKRDGRSGGWAPCDPPINVVNMLLKGQEYPHLRRLAGLARQPFFRPDGTLVTASGYDTASSVYAAFNSADFLLPEPTRENASEALGDLMGLLREFHFQSSHDLSAALCAMLTAAVRGSLRLAPAFNLSASASGSGKSYLASLISLFAGPGDPHSTSYPSTAEEATKSILAVLMERPAVVLFDDMQGNWTPYGALNKALTSATITERILGVSKTATVGTNCLFMGTGNNVEPAADMRRRVLSLYIAPPTGSPATLTYNGNPVEVVRRNRGQYVSAALTIIRAFNAAGSPRAAVPSIATYGDWSDLCRQPLLWLGLPDPATSLIEQVSHDPDLQLLGTLIEELQQCFADRAVTVRQIRDRAVNSDSLRYALEDLPIMERGAINAHRLGQYLKKQRNRIVDGYRIEDAEHSDRKGWRVAKVPVPQSTGVNG